MIFVDDDTFTRAFYAYHVGHYRPEYVHNHRDFENDDGSEKSFELEISEDEKEIYIISETYYQPMQCSHYPIMLLRVFLDDSPIPIKKVYSFE